MNKTRFTILLALLTAANSSLALAQGVGRDRPGTVWVAGSVGLGRVDTGEVDVEGDDPTPLEDIFDCRLWEQAAAVLSGLAARDVPGASINLDTCNADKAGPAGGVSAGVMVAPFLGVEGGWRRLPTSSVDVAMAVAAPGLRSVTANININAEAEIQALFFQGVGRFQVGSALVSGHAGAHRSTGKISFRPSVSGFEEVLDAFTEPAEGSGWGPQLGGSILFPLTENLFIGPTVDLYWVRMSDDESDEAPFSSRVAQFLVSVRYVFPRR